MRYQEIWLQTGRNRFNQGDQSARDSGPIPLNMRRLAEQSWGKKAADIARVLLGIFLAAIAAVLTASFVYGVWAAFAGGANTPVEVALHMAVYGSVVVFPIAFMGGIPLYFGFRALGWISPATVILGALSLALSPILYESAQNPSGGLKSGFLAVCAASAFVAAVVFVRFMGLGPPKHS